MKTVSDMLDPEKLRIHPYYLRPHRKSDTAARGRFHGADHADLKIEKAPADAKALRSVLSASLGVWSGL